MNALKIVFPLFSALFLCIMLTTNCFLDISEYKVVKITGVTGCYNITRNGMYFGSLPGKNGTVSVIAKNGDFLCMTFDDMFYYHLYLNKDGTSLKFKDDDFKVYLNGKLACLNIGNQSEAYDLLTNPDNPELKNLISLSIMENIDREKSNVLKAFVKKRGLQGLVINDKIEMDISFFNPEWYFGNAHRQLTGFSRLKYLCIQADEMKDFGNVTNLNGLNSLVLANWDAGKTGPISVNFKNLRLLSLFNPSNIRTDDIINCTNIKELIILANNNNDMKLHLNMTNLETLIISGIKIGNPEALKKIYRLKYLRLPVDLTMEDFKIMIKNNPRIQVLEIFRSENINDLSILKEMGNLTGLIINNWDIDLNGLPSLKKLKILIIPKDTYQNDGPLSAKFEKEMPECEIVPGEGLCLGPVWILTLLPAVFLSALYSAYRRKSGRLKKYRNSDE